MITAPLPPSKPIEWSYGILTIPSRRMLLERTISSLRIAGFNRPILFLDGAGHLEATNYERDFGLQVVNRMPILRVAANWTLALWQLYLTRPTADYLAIFNDDIITYSNLRAYLESRPVPGNGYGNLMTVPQSSKRILQAGDNNSSLFGWYESDQMGRGAAGLVFPRSTALALLSSRVLIDKPLLTNHKAWKNIDGTIVTAMNQLGYKEYIHYPSLIDHVGAQSSIGNDNIYSDCFWGERYDATVLLEKGVNNASHN